MKVLFLLSFHLSVALGVIAQDSTIVAGNKFNRDNRLDQLGVKMLEYNESLSQKIQLVDGFRLQLLSTTDRNQLMKVRSELIRLYPDQKLYTIFQTPYLKLKLGNFINKQDAEKFKKMLIDSKLITGSIYLVPEKVELKPDKKNQEEEP
jgi:hypothetical protein